MSEDFTYSTPYELVEQLRSWLGGKLVAYLGGATDTATVQEWINGTKWVHGRNYENLRTAYLAVSTLSEIESKGVIQAWFQGMNPYFNDEAPAYFIKHSELRWLDMTTEVVMAAKQYVSEQF